MYGRIQLTSKLQTRWNLIGRSVKVPPSVIAQQYSSSTFVSLSYRLRKQKFGALFKNVISILCCFKIT
jgi:hypothetical protein